MQTLLSTLGLRFANARRIPRYVAIATPKAPIRSDHPGTGQTPCGYPNNSITGLPVVGSREMALLFSGWLSGTSRA